MNELIRKSQINGSDQKCPSMEMIGISPPPKKKSEVSAVRSLLADVNSQLIGLQDGMGLMESDWAAKHADIVAKVGGGAGPSPMAPWPSLPASPLGQPIGRAAECLPGPGPCRSKDPTVDPEAEQSDRKVVQADEHGRVRVQTVPERGHLRGWVRQVPMPLPGTFPGRRAKNPAESEGEQTAFSGEELRAEGGRVCPVRGYGCGVPEQRQLSQQSGNQRIGPSPIRLISPGSLPRI